MTSLTLAPLLNIAQRAMLSAGKKVFFLRNNVDSFSSIQKADPILALELSKIIEKEIINELAYSFPDHKINVASDSSGAYSSENNEHQWHIGISGIDNLIHSFPFYAVSIAYCFNGKTQLGIVYNPATEESYVAMRQEGATLNDKRIRVAKPNELLANSFISLNTNYCHTKNEDALALIPKLSKQVKDIRMLGSEALDLCLLAEGCVAAFIGHSLNYTQIAAAQLIATEAGAIFVDFNGADADQYTQNILACSPKQLKLFLKSLA